MRVNRPELRIITVTILLGTLALALAVVIGYAWWSAERDLDRYVQAKVDLIAQFLENGMALLPKAGADLGGLDILMERVGQDNGTQRLEIYRGATLAGQLEPASAPRLPDGTIQQAFQTGRDVTVHETRGGRRTIRRLKVMKATPSCLSCHNTSPGEVLGVLDVSFDLERVQSAGPDFFPNLLLVSSLVSVITVLLVFLVFSRINMGRRIESVAALAGEIAAGDMERRVSPLLGVGVDGLTRAINDMAASLQAQQEALVQQQGELEEANRRLEVLVQESHHRIKNNLQTVADLLALQANDCPESRAGCLNDSIQRVKSIAAVHELLSVEQTESADIQQLARQLLRMAIGNIASPEQRISESVAGDNLSLASKQATALALVLSELFNNALIHGLAQRRHGQISVQVRAQDGQAILSVWDDGVGLPASFGRETHERLGLRIVRTLVEHELGGTISLKKGQDGAVATLRFPYCAAPPV